MKITINKFVIGESVITLNPDSDNVTIDKKEFKSFVDMSLHGRNWEMEVVVNGEPVPRTGQMDWPEYFEHYRAVEDLELFAFKNIRRRNS